MVALEAARQELRSSLAREVRANEMLKDSLGARKRMLTQERGTLLADVGSSRPAAGSHRTILPVAPRSAWG